MDGLSIAASVIAVVDMTAKISALCFQYSKDVKSAKADIDRLAREVANLGIICEGAQRLVNGPNGARLQTSRQLEVAVKDTLFRLTGLEKELRPGTARDKISRVGLRALKWPFRSKGLETTIQELTRCAQAVSAALQVDQISILLSLDQRTVLDKLPVAKGAAFDSHDEEHNATCLPNTRVDILKNVIEWTNDPTAKPLFWLNGMAGTGKSTISRTIAQTLSDSGRLGATFFFKRGEADRFGLSKFFTTIARDLAFGVPGVGVLIKDAIDADPTIVEKQVREQLKTLIGEPLLKANQDLFTNGPLVLVIDALDECEKDEDIRLLINLMTATNHVQSSRLKIFITSRPELQIRLGFNQVKETLQKFILHEVPPVDIQQDLSTFLDHELAVIRDEYNASVSTHRALSPNWPSTSEVQDLAKIAVPLFIAAVTACRFISDRSYGSPDEQLRDVLRYQATSEESQLDTVYRQVLEKLISGASDKRRSELIRQIQSVVGTIAILANPLSTISLGKLLSIPLNTIDNQLDLLHSVLSVPSSPQAPVRLLHLSFRDFLVHRDKRETHPFWIDEKQAHAQIMARCLTILTCLKQDICDLKRPGMARSAVESDKINACLPPEVQYACMYWVYHMQHAGHLISDGDQAHGFLLKCFLFWMEALSLLDKPREGIFMCRAISSRLAPQGSQEASVFINDATRFLQSNLAVIESNPLQLYSSLLLFAPEASTVRNTFKDLIPSWIKLWPSVDHDWGPGSHVLEGHRKLVSSVAFSHDSKLIASSSYDYRVLIWRVDTGQCDHELLHDRGATSVAFSHDSSLIGSGSRDSNLRIWNTETGECIRKLEHDATVSSVAFSHDSTLAASGSWNNKVCIWSVGTGKRLCVLCPDAAGENNHSFVTSISFSHDSRHIASGSGDMTVRVWMVDPGGHTRIMRHDDVVTSVAFSKDSVHIVSGSRGGSARVWLAASGECIRIINFNNAVYSTAFSHDSAFVASGSSDVRVHAAATGDCVQSIRHGGLVTAVAFSHDSTLIVSGCHDGMVRVWHASPRQSTIAPIVPLDLMLCMAVSDDKKLAVSGHKDTTIRLWSLETGRWTHTLRGSTSSVELVALSPDSTLIVSSSRDRSVRIWSVATHECIHTLQGHSDNAVCITFSPDSSLVALGHTDGVALVWRCATGEMANSLDNEQCIYCSAISGDSMLMAAGLMYATVRLWSLETSTCTHSLLGHGGGIWSISFSADSTLLASGDHDGTILVWCSKTGKRICGANIGGRSSYLSFSPDNQRLRHEYGTSDLNAVFIESASGQIESQLATHIPNLALSFDRCWITMNSEKLLWLPVKMRASNSIMLGSVYVVGGTSGEVVRIEFSINDLPQ